MVHVCGTCSGTRFEAVDGYFYCLECGTQSQNQQVEMEAEANVIMLGDRTIGADAVTLKKEKSNEGRITSWEEYNYILVGLVDEMVSLGANSRFKKCVLKIWTRYLQTTEAAFFSLEDECLPRLPVNYRKRDAEILYNKHHRKRPRMRRNSCSSVDSAETKSSTGKANSVIKSYNISKILKRTKAELARAQFEDFKKLDQDSSAVATSLATASQRTSGDEQSHLSLNLGFTRNARRVMKRKLRMGKKHIQKHETDHEDELDCHRDWVPPKPADKLEALDSNVLLGIICLALNLTQDPMQCSDVIRLMREGHLSYHNIRHFLPENVKKEGQSNFEALNRRGVFNHQTIRNMCGKLFRDTTIPRLIRPDLVALVHRYVDELQLPVELKIYVEKLIAYHPPRMELTQEKVSVGWHKTPAHVMPNYEARVISYIILALKMFFGLDDNREVKISNAAREINKQLPENSELHLFVVEDWLKMLKCRQLVVEKHHLPSAIRQPWQDLGSMIRGVDNWRMYVDHVQARYASKFTDRIPYMTSDRTGRAVANNTMLMLSGMSQRNKAALKDNDGEESKVEEEGNVDGKSFNFQPSLTPYKDYAKALLEENSKGRPLFHGNTEALLGEDFSLASLQVFYGDQVTIKRLKETLKQTRGLTLQVRELGLDTMHLKIVASDRFQRADKLPCGMTSVEIVTEEQAEQLLECNTGLKETAEEVRVPVKESDSPLKRQDIRLNISNMDYWQHYTCYKNQSKPFHKEALAEERRILPNNFQFLIYECARIIEQEPRHLLLQLALLERVLFLDKQGLDTPASYTQRPHICMW